MDHLVNNAGITPVCLFEETTDVTKIAPAMVICKYNYNAFIVN